MTLRARVQMIGRVYADIMGEHDTFRIRVSKKDALAMVEGDAGIKLSVLGSHWNGRPDYLVTQTFRDK